jgi:hypothetical protein
MRDDAVSAVSSSLTAARRSAPGVLDSVSRGCVTERTPGIAYRADRRPGLLSSPVRSRQSCMTKFVVELGRIRAEKV